MTAKGPTCIAAATAVVVTCGTVTQAVRIAQWLASIEARDGPAQDRRARAAALIGWIEDTAQHVEHVERGCQRLLLQAAVLVGEVPTA